jgi:hypothetical protein
MTEVTLHLPKSFLRAMAARLSDRLAFLLGMVGGIEFRPITFAQLRRLPRWRGEVLQDSQN